MGMAHSLGFAPMTSVFARQRSHLPQATVIGPAGSDRLLMAPSAVLERTERVCSARIRQTSTCSAMTRASSNSMPRWRTALSILACPSSCRSAVLVIGPSATSRDKDKMAASGPKAEVSGLLSSLNL
jgi:hypothetical protein